MRSQTHVADGAGNEGAKKDALGAAHGQGDLKVEFLVEGRSERVIRASPGTEGRDDRCTSAPIRIKRDACVGKRRRSSLRDERAIAVRVGELSEGPERALREIWVGERAIRGEAKRRGKGEGASLMLKALRTLELTHIVTDFSDQSSPKV